MTTTITKMSMVQMTYLLANTPSTGKMIKFCNVNFKNSLTNNQNLEGFLDLEAFEELKILNHENSRLQSTNNRHEHSMVV